MNRLTIIGNLTADPQARTLTDGTSVCNFTVAVNRRGKQQDGQPQADFFRVAAWRGLADACQKYLAKGRKVCVVGAVSVSTYQAQDGTTRAQMEVQAQDVEFLNSRSDGAEATPTPPETTQPTPVQIDDGELPF